MCGTRLRAAGRAANFLQDPKEEVRLKPGESFVCRPRQPHLVTNAGGTSATFLVLQGIGEYDFLLVKPKQQGFPDSDDR